MKDREIAKLKKNTPIYLDITNFFIISLNAAIDQNEDSL